MTIEVIYTKTTRGFAELSHRTEHLPRHYYEVLLAIDGRSDSRSLQCRRLEIPEHEFEGILRYFLEHGLIRPLSSEPEGEQFDLSESRISVDELDPEDGVRAWAQAKRGADELMKKGFFNRTITSAEAREVPEILVVEDDPVIARMEIKLLQNAGFKTRHADCGQATRAALTDWKPDLVTLDVRLPDANGFEILGWLRQHPDFSKLPIIMVTAETEAEDVLKGLRGGADGYIFKPFQAEALIQCIRKVLNIS